jgi:phosphoglycolate phosphatase-like HAD superfamily hydrolase
VVSNLEEGLRGIKTLSTLPTVGFDFDLTLADSRPSIAEALNWAISYHTNTELNQISIRLGSFTLDQIMKMLNIVDTVTFKKNFIERYLIESYKKTVLAPDCLQTLTTLKSKGCNLVLISSKSLETLSHSLNHLGLNQFFSKVVSVSQSGNKVTPIAEMKVTVYVGDTQSDIDSARMAGTQSVYFDYFSDVEVVNYNHRISNLFELVTLLNEEKLCS